MKITIDTKEDGHEEIRRVIALLNHLVGEGALSNNPSAMNETPVSSGEGTNAFGAMFGSTTPSTSSEDSQEEKKDDSEISTYY